MHAYFPALNSYPSLLGDMLADGINCLGFTWVSSSFYLLVQSDFHGLIFLRKALFPIFCQKFFLFCPLAA
jgi:hypothetical protein